MKLVIAEPETAALQAFLRSETDIATSRVALVEVAAAVARSDPGADAVRDAEFVLKPLLLVEADDSLLRRAAGLAGPLRSLDAIHLASALLVDADSLLVYDRRLAEAAESVGLRALAPGT